jgi:DNA-binding MarR family transcriptional regulator
MATRKRLQLDQFLPYRLSVVSNVVSSGIAAAYAQRFSLTISEWRVLAVLALSPNLSAAEVAQRTAMDKVAVSRAVARLLRNGRLRRVFARSDRRRSMLRLGSAGDAVYARVVPFAQRYEAELLAAIRPRERVILMRILDRLQQRADELERQ